MFYKIPSSCILLFELAHQKLKLVRCQGFEFWNYFQMCYIFLRLVWFMHKLVEFYTTSISSRYYPVAFGAWSYHRQCKFIVIENDKKYHHKKEMIYQVYMDRHMANIHDQCAHGICVLSSTLFDFPHLLWVAIAFTVWRTKHSWLIYV